MLPGPPCPLVSTWSPQPTAPCASWTEVLWYFSLCLQSIPESVNAEGIRKFKCFNPQGLHQDSGNPSCLSDINYLGLNYLGLCAYAKLFPELGILFHIHLLTCLSGWPFIILLKPAQDFPTFCPCQLEFLPLGPTPGVNPISKAWTLWRHTHVYFGLCSLPLSSVVSGRQTPNKYPLKKRTHFSELIPWACFYQYVILYRNHLSFFAITQSCLRKSTVSYTSVELKSQITCLVQNTAQKLSNEWIQVVIWIWIFSVWANEVITLKGL